MDIKFNSHNAVSPNFKGYHKIVDEGVIAAKDSVSRLQTAVKNIITEEFAASLSTESAIYVVCAPAHDNILRSRLDHLGIKYLSNTNAQPKDIAPYRFSETESQLKSYFA